MPEICRFFGIIIRMFAEPAVPLGSSPDRPHFYAYYQGEVAIIAVDVVELIGGGLPRRHPGWATTVQDRASQLRAMP